MYCKDIERKTEMKKIILSLAVASLSVSSNCFCMQAIDPWNDGSKNATCPVQNSNNAEMDSIAGAVSELKEAIEYYKDAETNHWAVSSNKNSLNSGQSTSNSNSSNDFNRSDINCENPFEGEYSISKSSENDWSSSIDAIFASMDPNKIDPAKEVKNPESYTSKHREEKIVENNLPLSKIGSESEQNVNDLLTIENSVNSSIQTLADDDIVQNLNRTSVNQNFGRTFSWLKTNTKNFWSKAGTHLGSSIKNNWKSCATGLAVAATFGVAGNLVYSVIPNLSWNAKWLIAWNGAKIAWWGISTSTKLALFAVKNANYIIPISILGGVAGNLFCYTARAYGTINALSIAWNGAGIIPHVLLWSTSRLIQPILW